MTRWSLVSLTVPLTLVLALVGSPATGQEIPEISGSLSNFDVRNAHRAKFDDFELILTGDIDPDCIEDFYPGWGAPPKVAPNGRLGRGGVSITWQNRRDPIEPGRSEHFGVRLGCEAKFEARGFWSSGGRPVEEVALPWQFWQARPGTIWDVITLPVEADLSPVLVQREFVTLPKPVPLANLNWDEVDEYAREYRQEWQGADRRPVPVISGEQLVLRIPVTPEDGATIVRYTVFQEGRAVSRFVNQAVLAWPVGPICFPNLPAPQLTVSSTEDYTGSDGNPYTRYRIPVVNRASFPDALFTPAPDLPPCGANANSSRTWVDIDDNDGNRLYGFCALGSAASLGNLWFARPRGVPPPECVSVTLNDRRCGLSYQSNCASTAGFGPDCINFEDPPLTTTYNNGDSFMDSGATMTVEQFQWSNGTWTPGNFARITNAGQAGHVGQELTVNNVNVRFNFPVAPNAVSLNFGEYGGNLNIEVNGDFRNFADFADIDGAVIGGTQVTVVNGFGNDQGTLRLNGDVHSFAIGGQELVIDHVCITEAPAVEADGTWVLPFAVGNTRLDQIQSDGLTDYTDGGSGFFMEDAPFGSRLGFRLGAANVIPTPGITYYRFRYKEEAAADYVDFDETVSVHYQREAPTTPPTFPLFVLGPIDFGGGKNLYRFRPHEVDLPGLVPVVPGTTVSWPSTGFLGDIYSGFLNTTAKNLAPGRYLVKLEVYDSAGSQVMPSGSTYRFIVPTGVASDGTLTTDFANAADIDAGGFVFALHVDNRHTTAVIDEPMIGAVGAGDCGFLEYDPASNELLASVDVTLHATHPADRALFSFSMVRGPNTVSLATVSGAEVSAASAGTNGIFGNAYVGDGNGSFDRRFARSELLNCCGSPCIEAAFSENLHVFAKATSGWHHRIGAYDSHAVRAFALTPQ